jgi:large subunit ribosomal protein L32
MPNPKHRHSKQRTAKRRTHYVAIEPTLSTCSNCGATTRRHHICSECGFYRGKQVIEKTATEKV